MRLNLKKEEGFTLIEALLSLVITSFILLFITSGITQTQLIKDEIIADSVMINHHHDTVSGDRQIEWHIFLNQLEHYLQGSKNPQVQTDLLIVEEWSEEENKYVRVYYRRPETNFRVLIRSQGGGTQYLLLGAYRIKFKLEDDGWLVVTNSFDGIKEYQGKIRVRSWIEETEKVEEVIE